MNYTDYNKQRCKEYYYRTKDSWSDEKKEKLREQARARQRTYYLKNKELVKLRIKSIQIRKQEKRNQIKAEIEKLNNPITQKEIKVIKEMNLTDLIKKSPRLGLWNKKISLWTFKDYNKILALI